MFTPLSSSARFISLILVLLVLRSTYYVYYYFLAKRYLRKYAEWAKIDETNSQHLDGWYVKEHQQDIRKLLLLAGIRARKVMVNEPIGWGQLITGTFEHLDNITLRRADMMTEIHADLREAVSVFWRKIFQSFNPFFWLEFVIFLPKHVLGYLGLSPDGGIVRLSQALWWLIAAGATVIGYWNKDFWNYIMSFPMQSIVDSAPLP